MSEIVRTLEGGGKGKCIRYVGIGKKKVGGGGVGGGGGWVWVWVGGWVCWNDGWLRLESWVGQMS